MTTTMLNNFISKLAASSDTEATAIKLELEDELASRN
jgi:hypothetical protein